MSKNYSIGDVIEVRIEKIVPRGFGLAFAEDLTVLVPLATPADVLGVRLVEIKKRLAFAEIVEIKQPGPQRVVPPCKYFGTCGGCDFQQMSYAAQLEAKVGIIRDCLHRIGRIEYDAEIPIIPSPNELAYRSRARWHLDRDRKTIGYYARDSHDVIDIDSCLILMPELESTLENVRETIERDTIWSGRVEIEAAIGEGGRVSMFSKEMAEPTADLSFSTGRETYAFSAETFFQANRSLVGDLIDTAIGDAQGGTAFDLYAGVGLFTLPMARHFAKVVAVEENSTAVEFAKKNVNNAGLPNVKVVTQSVSRFLTENQKKHVDLVLIDPPRRGTENRTISAIAELKPAVISYVSCEPSILARDLRVLLDGGYTIEKITALDLFPQTHHVETVVRLISPEARTK